MYSTDLMQCCSCSRVQVQKHPSVSANTLEYVRVLTLTSASKTTHKSSGAQE